MPLRRALQAVNFILGALLFFVLADALATLLKERETLAFAPSSEAKKHALHTKELAEVKPLSYYAGISERDLFHPLKAPRGKATTLEEIKEQVSGGELPETKLRLNLVGTVIGPPRLSFAVIDVLSKREQGLYRLGEVVIEGAKIAEIQRDRVILEKPNGRREVLPLYKAGDLLASRPPEEEIETKKSSPEPPKGKVITRSVSNRDVITATASAKEILKSLNIDVEKLKKEGKVGDTAGSLKDVVDAANRVLTKVKVEPNIVEGKLHGFKASDVKKGSLIEKMGVQSGDVIKSINGEPIDSLAKAFKIYGDLQNKSVISIDVERDGVVRTLTYKLGKEGLRF